MEFSGVEWVNCISPSAAQFFGALIGVGGGLIAILSGALLNASLNRRRDDRIRNQEARAVAAAVRGELLGLKMLVADQIPIWSSGKKEFQAAVPGINAAGLEARTVDAANYAQLPPTSFPIFEAYASSLGLLGSKMAGAISILFSNYRVRMTVFKGSLDIFVLDLPAHFQAQIDWGEKFCTDCDEFSQLLAEIESTGIAKDQL